MKLSLVFCALLCAAYGTAEKGTSHSPPECEGEGAQFNECAFRCFLADSDLLDGSGQVNREELDKVIIERKSRGTENPNDKNPPEPVFYILQECLKTADTEVDPSKEDCMGYHNLLACVLKRMENEE